jgi:hypothetical protein
MKKIFLFSCKLVQFVAKNLRALRTISAGALRETKIIARKERKEKYAENAIFLIFE